MNRENEIMEIRVDEIIPNRFQPRLAFNQAELKELADSIRVHGIIQPLVLRRVGDKYEIIAGERRHKAAMMAGLRTVPAIIMNIDDRQSAEVAVVENLQRTDLSAIEEAQSYKKLIDMGITQEELAGRMGIAQPTIANKLRLLNLTPEVQQALLKNQISERHARSLLQIPDKSLQIIMLNRIITERLTVRQTDDEISKILGRPISNPQVVQPTPSPNIPPVTPITGTQDNLAGMFNTPVQPVQEPIQNNNAFDVDINKIKTESEDIIKEHKPSDIDMLLRTEPKDDESSEGTPKKISLEDTAANVDMGELIKPGMAINPFQEINNEPKSFEIPTQNLENSTPTNSIIEEFKEQNPNSYQSAPQPNPTPVPAPKEKSISSAINLARTEAKKIEDLGFAVDTEEFDFEDMYQIIIKIKKN